METIELLKYAVEKNASDIFVIAGKPISVCINNEIIEFDSTKLSPDDTEKIIKGIYGYSANHNFDALLKNGSDDFAFAISGVSRFRISAYIQRNSYAAVIRVISFEIPKPSELYIPQAVIDLAEKNKGLILVTGPAGSGKSTTLACMIDKINNTKAGHIITLEDPIEFLHKHNKSIVSQREIYVDCPNYLVALKAALRQKPNVILLGEMRDLETISVALTAAETGHLVLSSLHTIGASNTINRILDAFPIESQPQIATQLSMVLQAVISQQLIPTVDNRIIPVFEIMVVNTAIKNLIRENKIHQIDNIISASASENMISMDASLVNLYNKGYITAETAIEFATNPDIMSRKVK